MLSTEKLSHFRCETCNKLLMHLIRKYGIVPGAAQNTNIWKVQLKAKFNYMKGLKYIMQ
jgi:hypothetical protein